MRRRLTYHERLSALEIHEIRQLIHGEFAKFTKKPGIGNIQLFLLQGQCFRITKKSHSVHFTTLTSRNQKPVKSFVFDNHPKCRISRQFFVLLRVTCLVTLFNPSFSFSKHH